MKNNSTNPIFAGFGLSAILLILRITPTKYPYAAPSSQVCISSMGNAHYSGVPLQCLPEQGINASFELDLITDFLHTTKADDRKRRKK